MTPDVRIQGGEILVAPGLDALRDLPSVFRDGKQWLLVPHYRADWLREKLAESVAGIASLRPSRRATDRRLYEFQIAGVEFLAHRSSALLADDMGLGKTVQAICAANAVGGDVLVACPAGLTGTWSFEIEKWAVNPKRFVVISYDTAKSGEVGVTLAKRKWSVAIYDEAHRAKGVDTLRNRWLCTVKAAHVWLLTGSPMLNRPTDLYGLLKVANHPLGSDEDSFIARFGTDGNSDPSSQRLSQELGLVLSPWILRREKRDVLTLPDKVVEIRRTQTSEHAPLSFGELMKARAALATEKAEATAELALELYEAGKKSIVFSCFREPLTRIRKQLEAEGMRVAEINGDVSVAQRTRIVHGLQTGAYDALLGQIIAAGEGFTMTAASEVIFNDLSYVPAQHTQGADRAHRIGQEKVVTVHYVISGCALDTAVWDIIQSKLKSIRAFEIASMEEQISSADILNKVKEISHGK